MNKVQKAALKISKEFLCELSNRFSNDGCNDFCLENTEENLEIYTRAVYQNGDVFQIQDLETNGRSKNKKQSIIVSNTMMVYACRLYLEDMIKNES